MIIAIEIVAKMLKYAVIDWVDNPIMMDGEIRK